MKKNLLYIMAAGLFIACGISYFTFRPVAANKQVRWEYKTSVAILDDGKDNNLSIEFNKLGNEGWELAAVQSESPPEKGDIGKHVFVFKREIK